MDLTPNRNTAKRRSKECTSAAEMPPVTIALFNIQRELFKKNILRLARMSKGL